MSHSQHSQLALTVLLSLAWRKIWRHRRRTVITLSSIAIGFGLAVLSIGIGDVNNDSDDTRLRGVNTKFHVYCTIIRCEGVRTLPNVTGWQ